MRAVNPKHSNSPIRKPPDDASEPVLRHARSLQLLGLWPIRYSRAYCRRVALRAPGPLVRAVLLAVGDRMR